MSQSKNVLLCSLARQCDLCGAGSFQNKVGMACLGAVQYRSKLAYRVAIPFRHGCDSLLGWHLFLEHRKIDCLLLVPF